MNDENEETKTTIEPTEPPRVKLLRGFQLLSPEERRATAARGGRAAHAGGKAHKWTPDEARRAGKKGGASEHLVRRGGRPRPATESK